MAALNRVKDAQKSKTLTPTPSGAKEAKSTLTPSGAKPTPTTPTTTAKPSALDAATAAASKPPAFNPAATTAKPSTLDAATAAASKPAAFNPPAAPIERSAQGYAVGTTAGGTKFERRAATGAELRAAQAARAAAKAAGQSKSDAEEAAVKAGVGASNPATPTSARTTPASTVRPGGFGASSADMNARSSVSSATEPAPTSTLGSATAAASKPAAFSPATINAASSTSAAASGDTYKYKPSSSLNLKTSYEYDAYDLVLEYLLSQGHAETVAEAHYVMMEMDAEMIGDIVEDGFNSSGRYDVGGGRTVGPVAGAIRSLVTGNLPKSKTYVPPSKQTATNRPPATPASKGDSGKLTDFGAGGGRAKLKQGMTVGQVERQGRMNKGDYSG